MVVDGVVKHRHAGEDGRLIFADVVQHILQVARVGDHHHARAVCQRKVHPRHHAVDVEERNAHQHHFAARDKRRHPRLDLQCIRRHVAMHGNRAFGHSRRPARILEDCRIVGGDFDVWSGCACVFLQQILHPDITIIQPFETVTLFFLLRQCEEQAKDGRQGFFDIGYDDLFQPRLLLCFFHFIVETAQDEHYLDVRIHDRENNFIHGIGGVDRHHHAARFEDAEVGNHKLRRVRHKGSHAVALLHAHLDQRRRHCIRQRVHLPV